MTTGSVTVGPVLIATIVAGTCFAAALLPTHTNACKTLTWSATPIFAAPEPTLSTSTVVVAVRESTVTIAGSYFVSPTTVVLKAGSTTLSTASVTVHHRHLITVALSSAIAESLEGEAVKVTITSNGITQCTAAQQVGVVGPGTKLSSKHRRTLCTDLTTPMHTHHTGRHHTTHTNQWLPTDVQRPGLSGHADCLLGLGRLLGLRPAPSLLTGSKLSRCPSWH